MKKTIFLLFSLIYAFSFSQSDTEVYLFDLNKSNDGYSLSNQKNISNNPGYDSQPHFYDVNTILFSSTRNGQTDIAKYNIKTGTKTFINSTPGGGEYSPQRIPKSDHVSAVRLDTTGLQRFYKYDIKTGESEELISDLKIAYPFWYDKNTTVAAVIGNNNLYLAVSNPKKGTNATIQTNVGRSIHQIPNSKNVSFISKKTSTWEIHSLDVKKLRSTKITDIEGKYEDICWMPDGSILLAKENQILRFDPKANDGWKVLFTLKSIQNISRIIVNPEGTKISVVAQESPSYIVQKQVEAYNNRDIEAFANMFSDDVKVYSYPNKLLYQGRKALKESYASFFESTPDLNCVIVKRIVSGNRVIDEELVTMNGRKVDGVAIYEVKNGKIISMTFL